MRLISQKVPWITIYILVLFCLKHPILEAFLVKNHSIMKKILLATTKYENLVNNTLTCTIKKKNMMEQLKIIHLKKEEKNLTKKKREETGKKTGRYGNKNRKI